MTIDLVVLGLVALFGVWGALTGAARQLAQYVALGVGVAATPPLAKLVGPRLAPSLGGAQSAGVALASVLVFVLVFFATRLLVAALLRRLWGGDERAMQARDRGLGLALGAARAAALCYLALCCAAYLEKAVTIGGKRLTFGPTGSLAFAFAAKHNVLEWAQFGGAEALAKVVTAASGSAPSADLEALKADPRFKRLLGSPQAKEAARRGDVAGLVQLNDALALLRDGQARALVERIAGQLPRE